jgi:hypothetical protein
MLAVDVLVVGLIVVLVTVLACLAWLISRRGESRGSITEAQARETAAPLTRAILRRTVASGRACYAASRRVARAVQGAAALAELAERRRGLP